jgi:hypothetical protein
LGFFQIGRGSAGFNPFGGTRPLAASDGVSLARFLEVGPPFERGKDQPQFRFLNDILIMKSLDPQSRDVDRRTRSTALPKQEAGSMSDIFTKRRPMVDLDEFERRLCPPCSPDEKDDDPLAELLRVIGGKDESHETDFEPNTQLSARAWQDAGGPGELNQPDAQVRLIGGDFAAIEAGLLGTKLPQAAIPSEAERSTVEDKKPNARAPLISGDFAAIEAGLLGAPRE